MRLCASTASPMLPAATMCFLQQKSVEQTDTMVAATAAFDRVLLGNAQAWDGFRVSSSFVSVPSAGDIVGCPRGSAGQQLNKIQEGPFGAEQASGSALEHKEHLVWLEAITVVHRPFNLHGWVDLPQCFINPRCPAKHPCLAGNNPGRGASIRRYQPGGNISRAEVFSHGLSHLGDNRLS